MFGAIILGLILVVIGALITIFANKIYNAIGPIPWAEMHLGTEGGSRLMYKLIGILFCVIGFLIATGLIRNVVLAVFGRIFFRQVIPA